MTSPRRSQPQQAFTTIRRNLADAPAWLAEGFARLVRSAPEDRLEQLMRTPARRLVLEAMFWQMPQHLDRNRAAGIDASIRWRITGLPDDGADNYQLEIKDRRCRVLRGSAGPDPRVTITLDGAELLRIAAGISDPVQAYFSGRIMITGDIMLAARVSSLFRIPGSRRGQPT